MIPDLLKKQRQYLNYFFDKLDVAQAEALLDLLVQTEGVIFTTGIGKSGLVAKKTAVMMTSTGTKALYLSPMDALHGDIGIVSKEDLFLFFSKGGESDELLNLVPYVRNKGAKLVALVSNPDSRLANACDLVVHLPVEKELCPFDLAPTTSSSVQMIFGDLMAIALMQKNQFQIDQYQLNHPAGRIGRRMVLKVEDLMLKGEQIPTCSKSDILVDELVELSNKQCGCVLAVDDEGRIEGIFTDGDLRRALQTHGPDAMKMTIESLMSSQPRTIGSKELIVDAIRAMEGNQKRPIMVLPVVDENHKLLGLLKMHDILQSGV